MLTFQEIFQRASHGPICSEHDFDLNRFVPTVRKLVKKYGIKYDPQTVIPWDDDLADRLWQAGLDLIEEVGVYCVDSERIIEFNRNEILQSLADAPKNVALGSGKDRKTFPLRRPEDERLPWCSAGAAGCPVSNELVFESLMQAYAEIPYTDSVPTPALTHVNGSQIIAGTPLEIEGCIRNVKLAKEALRRASRPDLCIANMVATGVKADGHIAGYSSGAGMGDMMEIGAIAEMKTDYDILSKVSYMTSLGGIILGETGPVLGGYCGGPEGTAITLAAYHIFAILILRASIHHPFCVHFGIQTSTPRNVLWTRAVANQAITRNSDVGTLNVGIITTGPASKTSLFEVAAYVLAAVVSGGSVEGTGAAKSTNPDYLSPMEPLMLGEVARAVAGLSRKEANQIVQKLLEKYEPVLENPPLGLRYDQCFDMETRKPKKESLDIYKEVRKDLINLGIGLKESSPYL